MKLRLKPRFVSRFDMLPIRWRLAVTSAILTFAILLAFGLVIAFFTERQMVGDFNDDVRDNASRIQDRLYRPPISNVQGPSVGFPTISHNLLGHPTS